MMIYKLLTKAMDHLHWSCWRSNLNAYWKNLITVREIKTIIMMSMAHSESILMMMKMMIMKRNAHCICTMINITQRLRNNRPTWMLLTHGEIQLDHQLLSLNRNSSSSSISSNSNSFSPKRNALSLIIVVIWITIELFRKIRSSNKKNAMELMRTCRRRRRIIIILIKSLWRYWTDSKCFSRIKRKLLRGIVRIVVVVLSHNKA